MRVEGGVAIEQDQLRTTSNCKGSQLGHTSGVTKEFIHKFKAGDLVDVKVKLGQWTGPHKLLKYEIDPAKKGANSAAHMEIEFGEERLERWLIVGVDQQMIRKHIPEEQKQRFTFKRVG